MKASARAALFQLLLLFLGCTTARAVELGNAPAGPKAPASSLASRMNLTPERLSAMAEPLAAHSATYRELAEDDPLKALYQLQEHARVSPSADLLLRYAMEYIHIQETESARRRDREENYLVTMEDLKNREFHRLKELEAGLAEGLGQESIEPMRQAADYLGFHGFHKRALDVLESARQKLEKAGYAAGSLEEIYDGIAKNLTEASWYAEDEELAKTWTGPVLRKSAPGPRPSRAEVFPAGNRSKWDMLGPHKRADFHLSLTMLEAAVLFYLPFAVISGFVQSFLWPVPTVPDAFRNILAGFHLSVGEFLFLCKLAPVMIGAGIVFLRIYSVKLKPAAAGRLADFLRQLFPQDH